MVKYAPIYAPIYTGPGPSAPVIGTAPSVTGTAQVGQVLTRVAGVWTGEPAPTVTGKWQKSTNGTTWTDIAGATGNTYTPVAGDVGATIRFSEAATNASGSVTSNSAATAAVIAAA